MNVVSEERTNLRSPSTNGSKPALRILMVTPQYFPHTGGVETHTFNVSQRLRELGVHITILTTDPSGTLPRRELQGGVEILRVGAWPTRSDLYVAPNIYRTIVNGSWDLIHCQGCHTFVPPVAILAAQRSSTPFIMTFHTGGHSSPFRNQIRDLQWRTLRPLFSRAVKLVAVSDFEAEYFRERLAVENDRVVVIPNGAQMPTFSTETVVESDPSLILSVGRLERYKGHQRLITALPIIRQQIPDARLRIVGTGPYEAELRKLVSELNLTGRVEIGAVPVHERGTMASVISQAAVVALISEYEAHPISVMEALALGKPVVVANTSGLKELADRGYATPVPLDSSADQIAAAVIQQMRSPSPVDEFTLPTWEECTERLWDLYHDAVRQPACAS